MSKKVKILILDDDKALLTQLKLSLLNEYDIDAVSDSEDALNLLAKNKYDIMLLDLHLPPDENTAEEGFRMLSKIKNKFEDMITIVITGDDDKNISLKAIELGAYDYFQKPFDIDELRIIINRALGKLQLEIENKKLRYQLIQKVNFKNIIGESKPMKEIYELIEAAADSEANVLITGESGTGKELVAKAIHYSSARRDNPFVVINCAALSETLLEDELFGHEKGAFTGAVSRRVGRFETANHGTIFLDEISSISPKLQAALLRVIQEKEFERLGSSETIKVDVRIISATNKPLEDLLKENLLREDFYYRINVFTIELPPLRNRKEDIILLINHFINIYNKKNSRTVKGISNHALELLEKYSWPGNVRELENVIERAVILAKNRDIDVKDLPEKIVNYKENNSITDNSDFFSKKINLKDYIAGIEKDLLVKAIKIANGKKKDAADILGISYRNIKYLCDKYSIK